VETNYYAFGGVVLYKGPPGFTTANYVVVDRAIA